MTTGFRTPIIKMIFLGMLVALAVGMTQFSELARFLKPEALRATIQSYGALAPAAYLIIYCLGPVLFVPGVVLSLAGGLAFGALWGTLLTVIGATIGATLAFLVARFLGRDIVERFTRGRIKALDEAAARQGFRLILILRLIPIVPFNALDYAAGLSGIRLRDYVLGTLIGIIPGTFAYVYLGSSLTRITSWHFLIALGLLVSITFLTLWIGRKGGFKRGRGSYARGDHRPFEEAR